MLNSPKMMPSFTGPLLVQSAGWRLSGSLAPAPHRRPCRIGQFSQKTFVKVFNKYSNIARQKKTLNSPNMMPLFTGPLPVQCGGGRRPGSLAPASHDCSTSEAFSPRTVLTESICGCVQQIFQHRPVTIPFLTTSTITFSCLASAAPQADSWRLGHVEPDDGVIADIKGQALDIFLHGQSRVCAQEWHRKDIQSHIHNDLPELWQKRDLTQYL